MLLADNHEYIFQSVKFANFRRPYQLLVLVAQEFRCLIPEILVLPLLLRKWWPFNVLPYRLTDFLC